MMGADSVARVLYHFHKLTHVTSTTVPLGMYYYYSHLTDKKIEA